MKKIKESEILSDILNNIINWINLNNHKLSNKIIRGTIEKNKIDEIINNSNNELNLNLNEDEINEISKELYEIINENLNKNVRNFLKAVDGLGYYARKSNELGFSTIELSNLENTLTDLGLIEKGEYDKRELEIFYYRFLYIMSENMRKTSDKFLERIYDYYNEYYVRFKEGSIDFYNVAAYDILSAKVVDEYVDDVFDMMEWVASMIEMDDAQDGLYEYSTGDLKMILEDIDLMRVENTRKTSKKIIEKIKDIDENIYKMISLGLVKAYVLKIVVGEESIEESEFIKTVKEAADSLGYTSSIDALCLYIGSMMEDYDTGYKVKFFDCFME